MRLEIRWRVWLIIMLSDRFQDGNGEIDLNELRTVMTSLGYNPTDKQLQDMMDKVRRRI